jgi:predicted transcriptional regulator
VLVLNSTGAAIVQHCDGRSRDDLVAAIREKYKDAAEGEVSAFLDRLAEKGLLRDADA